MCGNCLHRHRTEAVEFQFPEMFLTNGVIIAVAELKMSVGQF